MLNDKVEKLQAAVAQQQKQIETLTAQLSEQANTFTAQLKEQAAQIQKVSAHFEVKQAGAANGVEQSLEAVPVKYWNGGLQEYNDPGELLGDYARNLCSSVSIIRSW